MRDKISINIFDSSSWQKAIKEVDKYQKELDKRCMTFLQKCAESVVQKARINFENAQYTGINDVSVYCSSVEKKGDRYVTTVHADGESVLFIEFGTGTRFGGELESEERGSIISGSVLGRGEYGLQKGANPPWVYVGEPGNAEYTKVVDSRNGQLIVRTYGHIANSSLYRALLEVEEKEIDDIAKEVFG